MVCLVFEFLNFWNSCSHIGSCVLEYAKFVEFRHLLDLSLC